MRRECAALKARRFPKQVMMVSQRVRARAAAHCVSRQSIVPGSGTNAPVSVSKACWRGSGGEEKSRRQKRRGDNLEKRDGEEEERHITRAETGVVGGKANGGKNGGGAAHSCH